VQKSVQNFGFSDASLRMLKAEGYSFDRYLPGFGIYVGKRRKTFIAVRDGRRTRIGTFPETTLQDARKRARAILSSDYKDTISVADAVDEYLHHQTTRPRTQQEYRRILHRYLIPALGHRNLTDVTARDILAITDKLIKTPQECRHAHVAMQTFWNHCVPRYLPISPMAGLRCKAKPAKRTRVLTPAEIKRVWHAQSGYALDSIVRICILAAIRRSEAAQIQPCWIDGDTLTIPASVSKNRKAHRVAITPMLRPYLEQAPFPSFNWSRAKSAHDSNSTVKNYVLHDLRRSACSLMAGPPISAPPHLLSRILSHSTDDGADVTLIYNRHRYDNELRQVFMAYHDHLAELLKNP
jgi:integrase